MSGRTLTREIALVLAVKLAALLILYFLFFGPSHKLRPDASSMAQHLLVNGDGPARVTVER